MGTRYKAHGHRQQQVTLCRVNAAPRSCKASILLSPHYHYIIVPYTREWGVEMSYTMRIFTRQEMKVEALPELFSKNIRR